MNAAIAMPRSLAEASRTGGVIACANLLASMSDGAYYQTLEALHAKRDAAATGG